MKRVIYIISALVVLTVVSCSELPEEIFVDGSMSDEISFVAKVTSNITKVTGSSWDDGDSVGITIKGTKSGATISDNIEYLVDSDTSLYAANSDEKLFFPVDGSAVDIYAYYPYQDNWSGDNRVFDISNQSTEGLSVADLMLSEDIKGQISGDQELVFKHSLSKIKFSIVNSEKLSQITSIDDIAVVIRDIDTKYNLNTGEYSSTGDIEMTLNANDDCTDITATAIILPTNNAEIKITFTIGGNEYIATLKEDLKAGVQYLYSVTLGEYEQEVTLSGSTILDWDDSGEFDSTLALELVDGVYQIYTSVGLKYFAEMVNNGDSEIDALLMNDIEVCGEWTPIGVSLQNGYSGIFDGGGFTVTDLNVITDDDYFGFFGYTKYATIKNLTIDDSTIIGANGSYTAGIAGYSYKSTFEYCINMADVSSEGGSVTAGIVGEMTTSSVIINSMNLGDISATSGYTGGIAGVNYDSELFNSYNSGVITGNLHVGGVIGYISGKGSEIYNCYNSAVVGGANGGFVGGIVGWRVNSDPIVDKVYFDSSSFGGYAIGSTDEIPGYTRDYMQSSTFIERLNDNAANHKLTLSNVVACKWIEGVDKYPTLDFNGKPESSDQDEEFSGGDGDNDSPYIIETIFDLRKLSSDVSNGEPYNDVHFEMVCDIDLEDEIFPVIGTTDYAFEGIFDGGNNEVIGLYVDEPTTTYQGLFGRIKGATIKNLGVRGSVTGYSYVGGIVGSATNISVIIDCYNYATVNGEGHGSCNTGGIVGFVNSLSCVINCYNNAKVTGVDDNIGGIVGYIYGGGSSVQNCYNRADITGNKSISCSVGGIVGYVTAGAQILNCYSTALVSASSDFGGVVGYISTHDGSEIGSIYFNVDNFNGKVIGSIVDYNSTSDDDSDVGYVYKDAYMKTAAMQNESFVETLNKGVEGCSDSRVRRWRGVTDDYPIFE